MGNSDIELEKQLKEAGISLLNPPPSVDELLDLLDKIECLLANVEQAPPRTMQDALLPPMKGLISSAILRHSDADVKISVASCMSEITRITAPDAPYNDDQMKGLLFRLLSNDEQEIFQLTVAAIEKIPHASGRCYTRAVSILENVAKVRSCLLMLDLELDELIIQMFKHFLKFIRSNHPNTVILAMETIMTLVINESEDISVELLSPLLLSVRKQNQSVSPMAWKLGEKVMTNCAAKLKPHLNKVVQSTGRDLDEYAPIVASICQNESHDLEGNHVNGSRAHLMSKELSPNAALHGREFEGIDVIPKSKASNATASIRNADTVIKDGDPRVTRNSKSSDARDKAEPEFRLEMEPEIGPRKRGRKPNSLMNPEEGYDHSWISTTRKTAKLPRERSHDRDIDDSPSEIPMSKSVALSSMHENVTKQAEFTPKRGHISGSSSPSPELNVPGGSHSKRGWPKRKEISMIEDADPSPFLMSKREILSSQGEEKAPESGDVSLEKRSEERSDSEAKKQKHLRKVALGSKTVKKTSLCPEHLLSAKKSQVLGEPEEEPLPQSIVVGVRSPNKDNWSVKTDPRKRISLDGTLNEGVTEIFSHKKTNLSNRDGSYLEESPKPKFKRKRTPRTEVPSETPNLGEQLIGSKVKVWWPMDKRFYDGVVDSYDPIKKRHRILYADGDEETLNLKKQRWELINDDKLPDAGQEFDVPKLDASSDTVQKVKQKVNRIAKSESHKKLKATSERSGVTSASKRKARRSGGKSAVGNMHDKPSAFDNPIDHDTCGADGGSEDDGKNSTVKLKIHALTDINSKQATPETVSPSNNGDGKVGNEYHSINSQQTTSNDGVPKLGDEYCSINSQQTAPDGVTPSNDDTSKGGDEVDGIEGARGEQQQDVSSSPSAETN